MYVSPNIKTKKDLKAAVKAGLRVEVYSLGPFPAEPEYVYVYPWYAWVLVKDGVVVKVIG